MAQLTSMSERGLLARRAGLVALGTFASRVLGLARDSVMAAVFPVGASDLFILANTIPNTFRMLLGEGAISQAFVPVFADVRTKRGEPAARRFLARFAGAFALLLALTSLAGMALAPLFGLGYAGGLLDEPARFSLVVSLTRALFPFLALIGLAALATGALNVLGVFTVPSLAAALLNVPVVLAPFVLAPVLLAAGLDPIFSLAIGTLLGGLLQLVAQLPALRRRGMLPRPRLALRDPDVRRAFALMGPMVLGLGIYQLNIMLSRLFTSFLPPGSQLYLYLGARVIEIPQGMFALAIASAALPTLSRLHSEGKHEELMALFRDSLRLTLFIALPASALLSALAEPIAAVFFGRGEFEARHIVEASRSLAVQALGVWAVASVRVVVPMFAAHQDTRTPVVASGINLVVFLSVAGLLLTPLSHVAIALANSVAAAVQLGVLCLRLRRHTGPLRLGAVASSALRVGLASGITALTAYLLARQVAWTEPGREAFRLAALGVISAISLTVFVGAALALRAPELRELVRSVRRRRSRAT